MISAFFAGLALTATSVSATEIDVSLRVLTSRDPRVCDSRYPDKEFTITSRANTTNALSAPRSIVVNGFEIPVRPPQ